MHKKMLQKKQISMVLTSMEYVTPEADRLKINISEFSSGLYFVRFTKDKIAVTN